MERTGRRRGEIGGTDGELEENYGKLGGIDRGFMENWRRTWVEQMEEGGKLEEQAKNWSRTVGN